MPLVGALQNKACHRLSSAIDSQLRVLVTINRVRCQLASAQLETKLKEGNLKIIFL
jgi:hypothetical protein